MGLSFMKRSCTSSPYAAPNSNPDPNKFFILREKAIKNFLILEVHYPNCTNFEGRKIMVFLGFKNSTDLLKAKNSKLDPHFSEDLFSPVARFMPTELGWKSAQSFVRYL